MEVKYPQVPQNVRLLAPLAPLERTLKRVRIGETGALYYIVDGKSEPVNKKERSYLKPKQTLQLLTSRLDNCVEMCDAPAVFVSMNAELRNKFGITSEESLKRFYLNRFLVARKPRADKRVRGNLAPIDLPLGQPLPPDSHILVQRLAQQAADAPALQANLAARGSMFYPMQHRA